MVTIDRCPHCEGIGTLWSTDAGKTVYAVCMSCGTRTKDCSTPQEAAELWNRRVARIVSIEKIFSGLSRQESRPAHKAYEGPMFECEGQYVDLNTLKCKLMCMGWDAKSKEEKKMVDNFGKLVDSLPTIKISGGESK